MTDSAPVAPRVFGNRFAVDASGRGRRADEAAEDGRDEFRPLVDLTPLELAVPPPTRRAADVLTKRIRTLIARDETPALRMFADDVDIDAPATASEALTGATSRRNCAAPSWTRRWRRRAGRPTGPITQGELPAALAVVGATCA